MREVYTSIEIEAENFDDAEKQLEKMFEKEIIDELAWYMNPWIIENTEEVN